MEEVRVSLRRVKKMALVKNTTYRKFLDDGVIEVLTVEQFEEKLKNLRRRRPYELQAWRALMIFLYYTGASPCHSMLLFRREVRITGNWLIFDISTKNGLVRTVYVSRSRPLVNELFKWINRLTPDLKVFAPCGHTRQVNVRGKQYEVLTGSISVEVRKTFGFPAYYFRHSRLSSLGQQGVDRESLKVFAGVKNDIALRAHVHFSPLAAKKIGRKIK